jgi:hypothetical protein
MDCLSKLLMALMRFERSLKKTFSLDANGPHTLHVMHDAIRGIARRLSH